MCVCVCVCVCVCARALTLVDSCDEWVICCTTGHLYMGFTLTLEVKKTLSKYVLK